MTERTRRLFFALWPDDLIRASIVERTAGHLRAAGGRPTSRASLHVTVAFLGSVVESRLGCVNAATAEVVAEPFELALTQVDHWKRSRILALQPAESPAALVALVGSVWRALRECAFEAETRPFRTHVTLARDARAPRGLAPDIEPVRWHVRELSLMESITAPEGTRYERLQSWPLGA
jgi:RNA 2',3'-cyclic 3'-phosphodiesterase